MDCRDGGDADRPAVIHTSGRHRTKQVGDCGLESCPGGSDQFIGPFNLGWRGEFSAWRQAIPDLTGPATGRKSPDDEELNRERPDPKGLPVSFLGDGAEP